MWVASKKKKKKGFPIFVKSPFFSQNGGGKKKKKKKEAFPSLLRSPSYQISFYFSICPLLPNFQHLKPWKTKSNRVIDGPNVDLSSWPIGVTASYLFFFFFCPEQQQPNEWPYQEPQCYNHIIPKPVLLIIRRKHAAS